MTLADLTGLVLLCLVVFAYVALVIHSLSHEAGKRMTWYRAFAWTTGVAIVSGLIVVYTIWASTVKL